MSRKKFIKLLMSFGISRNTARLLASRANAHGVPYLLAMLHITEYAKWRLVQDRLMGAFERSNTR